MGANLDGQTEGDAQPKSDDGEDFGEETVGCAHKNAEGEVDDKRDPGRGRVVSEEGDETWGSGMRPTARGGQGTSHPSFSKPEMRPPIKPARRAAG